MGIHFEDEENGVNELPTGNKGAKANTHQPKEQAMEQNNQGQQGQQAEQEQRLGDIDLMSLGRDFGVGFSTQFNGETLSKLEKSAIRIISDVIRPSAEYMIIPMDQAQYPGNNVSLLVVCRQLKDAVYFHTLLLEATALPLRARTDNSTGAPIELFTSVEDYMTNQLHKCIVSEVSNGFKVNKAFSSGVMVVRPEFKLDDDASVARLLTNAMLAIDSEIRQKCDAPALDLKRVRSDQQLMSTVSFGNDDVIGVDGLPRRADTQVDVNVVNITPNARIDPSAGRPLTTLTAYTELVPVPVTPAPGTNPAFAPSNKVQFAPMVVITSARAHQMQSLETTLLALFSVMAVIDNFGWVKGLMPRNTFGKKQDVDLRDIGAIGYETNILENGKGVPYKTDTESFSEAELRDILSTCVVPSPMIAMDCTAAGPDQFATDVFAKAARPTNDPAHAVAVTRLLQALDKLTGNEFGALWKQVLQINPNAKLVLDSGNRVFVGYYTDKEGMKDIRNLDHIAALNLQGARNPGMAKELMGTNLFITEPLHVRMARRRRIYASIFTGNVVLRGTMARVIFTADFIKTMDAALNKCGVTLVPEVVTQLSQTDAYATATYAQAAMYSGQTAFVQAQASNNNQGNAYGAAYTANQWVS